MKWFVLAALMSCGPPPPPPPIRNAPTPAPDSSRIAMQGPFTSAQLACKSIPACVSINFGSDEDPAPSNPTRDCEEFADDIEALGQADYHHSQNGISIHVFELSCIVPRYVPRDVTAGSMHLVVHRDDGWWIGPGWFSHDDQRNCGQGFEVKAWSRHGTLDAVSAQLTRSCWGCGKSVTSSTGEDFEIVVDATSRPPAVFPPITVGSSSSAEVDESAVELCPVDPPVTKNLPWRWANDRLIVDGVTHRFD